MSDTKEKRKYKKCKESQPVLTDIDYIKNKQIEDDMKSIEKYMDEGFMSN